MNYKGNDSKKVTPSERARREYSAKKAAKKRKGKNGFSGMKVK